MSSRQRNGRRSGLSVGSQGNKNTPPLPKTYETSFPAVENPVSEGGAWVNVGLDWAGVKTISGGKACGNMTPPGNYNDPYTHLTGFSANHKVSITVFYGAGWVISNNQELEIHLRVTDSANSVQLYEITLINQFSTIIAYNFVRWNGARGNFTILTTTSGTDNWGMITGDVCSAQIIGSNITVDINGVTLFTASDSVLTTGQPGFGFYTSSSGANEDLCISHFKAADV